MSISVRPKSSVASSFIEAPSGRFDMAFWQRSVCVRSEAKSEASEEAARVNRGGRSASAEEERREQTQPSRSGPWNDW